MLCREDKLTFPLPGWSIIKNGIRTKKVYSIFDSRVLVCYAKVGSFFYDNFEDKDIHQPTFLVWSIDCVETNPKYRKKGYATKILTTIFDDYPDHHFVIEPIDDDKVNAFYAKLGFRLLYYDGGYDIYTLLKLSKNSKHDFDEVSSAISECDDLEPCFFFDNTGVKWDAIKKVYPGYETDSDDE